MEDDIPQWEYKSSRSSSSNALNELGKEGWEAYASTAHGQSDGEILLKRKVTKPKQKHDDYGYGR